MIILKIFFGALLLFLVFCFFYILSKLSILLLISVGSILLTLFGTAFGITGKNFKQKPIRNSKEKNNAEYVNKN